MWSSSAEEAPARTSQVSRPAGKGCEGQSRSSSLRPPGSLAISTRSCPSPSSGSSRTSSA
eukprot:9487093-Lingulodinium_polyedra.AAC.1